MQILKGKMKTWNLPQKALDISPLMPILKGNLIYYLPKELKMKHEYVEMPGVDHGSVIYSSLPSVYKFFDKHKKH